MDRLNFSTIDFITTTCPERQHLLLLTLGSVMNVVTGAQFHIVHYREFPRILDFYLSLISKETGNSITYLQAEENTSVAHTKRMPSIRSTTKNVVNLDDDLLIPKEALQVLLSLTGEMGAPVITIGVVDTSHVFGWDFQYSEIFEDLADFFRKTQADDVPIGLTQYQRYRKCEIVLDFASLNQLYCLRTDIFMDNSIWDPVLLAFQKKGVRGYDVLLSNLLREKGIPITLILGHEALHLGMEHGFFSNKWEETAYEQQTMLG